MTSVLSSSAFFAMQVSKSNLGLCSALNFVYSLSLLLVRVLRTEMRLNYQDAKLTKLAVVERLCTE